MDFRARSLRQDREAAVADELARRLANDRVLPKPALLVMSHRVRDHRARSLGREGLQVTDEAHHVRVTDDRDRKSTRLNSSHGYISYAVFCLKKKKHIHHERQRR